MSSLKFFVALLLVEPSSLRTPRKCNPKTLEEALKLIGDWKNQVGSSFFANFCAAVDGWFFLGCDRTW